MRYEVTPGGVPKIAVEMGWENLEDFVSFMSNSGATILARYGYHIELVKDADKNEGKAGKKVEVQ